MTLLVCIAANGCGGSDDVPPPDEQPAVLQPNVMVLPDDGTVTLSAVTDSSVTVQGSAASIAPGAVIVSAAGSGMARKVISVTALSDAFVCQTENASLTDIFKEVHLKLRRQISPADALSIDVVDGFEYVPPTAAPGRSLLEFNFKYTNEFPGSVADSLKMSTSADAKFKIELGVDVEIEDGALIKFSVVPAIITSTSFEMAYKAKFEKKYPEEPLTYARIEVRPLLFWIGPVPVVVQPKVTFSGQLAVSVEGGAKMKGECSSTYRGGTVYDAVADTWTPIREAVTSGTLASAPSAYVNAEASLSLAQIGFELLFYGVVGPKLELDAGKLSAKWEAKESPDLSSKLSCTLGFSLTGVVKGDAFGKNVSYSFGPKIEAEYTLFEKTFMPGNGDVEVRSPVSRVSSGFDLSKELLSGGVR
ncbi:MAG: hypothetical protein ACAH95_05085 [Fimbriimonas sp.]